MTNEQADRTIDATQPSLQQKSADNIAVVSKAPDPRSLAERIAYGRDLRKKAPRSSHKDNRHAGRDPIDLIEMSSQDRVKQLVQLRHGRMLASPFTFFRGTALIQAHDLQYTPRSDIVTQICGDCHLLNFGGYASPERQLIFEINDFDETDSGYWEWDLKRLTASFAIAARHLGHSESALEETVYAAATSYQRNITTFANLGTLELWYQQTTAQDLLDATTAVDGQEMLNRVIAKAKHRTHEDLLPKIASHKDGKWTIHDTPPTIFHLLNNSSLLEKNKELAALQAHAHKFRKQFYDGYLETLPPYRRNLLKQFRIHDLAFKVVGVGSVGTRCLIILLTDAHDTPLFLQFKEARPSVVAQYTKPKSRFRHQGERVVEGQRLMQAASDIFLGWTAGPFGRHFYVRQLRDMKVAAPVETMNADRLTGYARMCGLILARSHAKSGLVAPEIRGYIGKSDTFAMALLSYAKSYTDQAERDYERFRRACRNGRLQARTDEDLAYDLSMATK